MKPSWWSASSMLVSSIGLFNGLPIFTFPPNMPPEELGLGWHMRSVLNPQGLESPGKCLVRSALLVRVENVIF